MSPARSVPNDALSPRVVTAAVPQSFLPRRRHEQEWYAHDQVDPDDQVDARRGLTLRAKAMSRAAGL
jgi:hypothetical protein